MIVHFLVLAVRPCFALQLYAVESLVQSLLGAGLSIIPVLGFAIICILLFPPSVSLVFTAALALSFLCWTVDRLSLAALTLAALTLSAICAL